MSRLGAAIVALFAVAALAACSHGSTPSACSQLKGNKLANSVSGSLQKAMVGQATDDDYAKLKSAAATLRSLAKQKQTGTDLGSALTDAASSIDGVTDRQVTDADIKHVQTAFDNLGKEVKSSCVS